jgi:hypothetical protein
MNGEMYVTFKEQYPIFHELYWELEMPQAELDEIEQSIWKQGIDPWVELRAMDQLFCEIGIL